MGFFSWITVNIKAAVLAGFHEAAAELQLTNATDANAMIADMRDKLALPAPEAETKVTRKGK